MASTENEVTSLTKQEPYSVLGVSEQLKQEFTLLQETQLLNGENKFSEKSVSVLASHLVCRNYAKLCYEFSHFCWMVLHAKGLERSDNHSLLSFFWIDDGHYKSGCAAFFQKHKAYSKSQHSKLNNDQVGFSQSKLGAKIRVDNNKKLVINSDKVSLTINEYAFSINYSRANVLSCFMEWLILIVPDLLDTITNTLIGQGTTAIKEIATWLQKQIYAYLSNHLMPAKLQKRYRLLNSYFQGQEVDCQQILLFWQQYKFSEGCAKYSNVLNDSLAFDYANKLEHKYAKTATIDRIDDAVSTSIFDEMMTMELIELQALGNEPKIYNKKQLELLSFIAQHPMDAIKYSHSYLRLEIFGNAQTRVIQGVRDNKLHVLSHYIEKDYEDVIQDLDKIIDINNQALMAMYPILINLSCKHACVLLNKLCQNMDGYKQYSRQLAELLAEFYENYDSKLTEQDDSVSIHDESEDKLRKEYLVACKNWKGSFSWFKDLVEQTECSLKMINRKGFTKQTRLTTEKYVKAAESLLKLNQVIKQILSFSSKRNMLANENFEADRSIFLKEFSELYIQDEK